MELIEKMNINAIDFKIQNLDSIAKNKELELLIYTIRMSVSNDTFENDNEIDAYFKAAILVFNNLKEPYWKGVKKGEVKYDDYFQSKMDLIFSNDKHNAINQLYSLWLDKKTTTIEYNLRGLEFILREYSQNFDENIIKMIIKVIRPLIDKAEQRLKTN